MANQYKVTEKDLQQTVDAWKSCSTVADAARRLGLARSSFRTRLAIARRQGLLDEREVHPLEPAESSEPVYERGLKQKAKVYIVTAAQNATPVDPEWWQILLQIAKQRKAELLVIPVRYKNPTSQWSGSQEGAEWWEEEVRPYLWNVRKALNANLTVLGDLKIQPTASSPLTGADALSLASSGIIGHTKLQMKTVPTPSNRMAKILTTTGACTVENYTDSRAGKIAEFHHSLSAIIVEIEGGHFHMRQLHYDRKTSSCTDLDTRYYPNGYGKAPPALALVMGDTHVRFIDPNVEAATFGPGGIIQTLQPQHLIWHDVLDAYSCNPHHEGDPFVAVAKIAADMNNVRDEVKEAIDFVLKHTPRGMTSVIIDSNHDDFLRRWIVNGDWKRNPRNAEFYLETALAMVRGTRMTGKGTEYPSPFAHWLVKASGMCAGEIRAMQTDESFVLGGVELSMHGDRGPNGARGTIRNLRRIGIRSVIGHSHAPGIDEGCYQTGTSTRLRLEYNHGASGWLNAHCVVNADGKRQIIIIIDGDWRA